MTRLKVQKGFNLVELMVVVAIIAILTMIAYPAYQDQMRKNRRSDAKIALTQLANLQEGFFSRSEPPRYTSILGVAGVNYPVTSPEGHYDLAVTVWGTNNRNFEATATAKATGGQAGDKLCKVFSITNTGLKTSKNASAQSTNGKCW